MGMNSAVVNGRVVPGQTLRIPPFNGIEVTVSGGSTWADVAATYQVRADVLFEINGCVCDPTPPDFCAGGELAARCGAGHGAGLNRYPSPTPISPGGRGPDCDQLWLAAPSPPKIG
jgi:hypothetical protein